MRTLLLSFVAALALGACHKPTPPELYPDRPICVATTARACVAPGGTCVDDHGYKCAHCEPANPALDGCYLDGVNDPDGSDITADEWWTCFDDCTACSSPRAGESCAAD